MKKTPNKTKRRTLPRKPPVNRQLTKELVAAAIVSMRKAGLRITVRALRTAAGGKGSNSTLTRLKREIEAERPDLMQNLGVSRAEAVAFIDGCDRSDLPALEEAMRKRRRVISPWQDHLLLEIYESPEAAGILADLGAEYERYKGWTLKRTLRNYDNAIRYGFTASSPDVAASMRKDLEQKAARAEWRE